MKKRPSGDAVRKYTEQAKFNQIRDSSLSNPLGRVLVPAFDVFSFLLYCGENEFTRIRAPCASATYAVLTEGKKFLQHPRHTPPCTLVS